MVRVRTFAQTEPSTGEDIERNDSGDIWQSRMIAIVCRSVRLFKILRDRDYTLPFRNVLRRSQREVTFRRLDFRLVTQFGILNSAA